MVVIIQESGPGVAVIIQESGPGVAVMIQESGDRRQPFQPGNCHIGHIRRFGPGWS
ncbi:hypothetical protein GCM10027057_00700 [Marisediminicola antarctica]